MRHYFIIVATMLCMSVSCAAQIRFGVEAGANYSMTESDSWRIGYQAGVTVSKEFDNHMTFSTALSYQHVELNLFLEYYTPGVTSHPESIRKLDELVVPIRIGYRFSPSEKFQWEPSAGIYGNYIFHENRWDVLKKRISDHFSYGWTAGVKGIVARNYTIALDYRMSLCDLGYTMLGKEHSILLSVGYLF